MKTIGAIRHQLKQVRFRHRKRYLRRNLKFIPENCRHNALLKYPDDTVIRMCTHLEVADAEGFHVCDEECGGVERARACQFFEVRKTQKELVTEFNEFFRNATPAEVSAHFPDAAALMWVLEEPVEVEEDEEEEKKEPDEKKEEAVPSQSEGPETITIADAVVTTEPVEGDEIDEDEDDEEDEEVEPPDRSLSTFLQDVILPIPSRSGLLAIELPVSPHTAPYLVSGAKKPVIWVPEASNGKIRAAIREAPSERQLAGKFLASIVTMSQKRQWGSVFPLSAKGIKGAIKYLQNYEFKNLMILHHSTLNTDIISTRQTENGIRQVVADWLPRETVLVLPEDKTYVGSVCRIPGKRLVAVVHNASRGIAIARK